MSAGEVEAVSKIPEEVECPFCKGVGYLQEFDEKRQCEECGGDGRIVIRDYAEEYGLTPEEAFQSIESLTFDEEE